MTNALCKAYTRAEVTKYQDPQDGSVPLARDGHRILVHGAHTNDAQADGAAGASQTKIFE